MFFCSYVDNFNCIGSCYVMIYIMDGINMGVDFVYFGLINGKGMFYINCMLVLLMYF